jgi:hypothetical protein
MENIATGVPFVKWANGPLVLSGKNGLIANAYLRRPLILCFAYPVECLLISNDPGGTSTKAKISSLPHSQPPSGLRLIRIAIVISATP